MKEKEIADRFFNEIAFEKEEEDFEYWCIFQSILPDKRRLKTSSFRKELITRLTRYHESHKPIEIFTFTELIEERIERDEQEFWGK